MRGRLCVLLAVAFAAAAALVLAAPALAVANLHDGSEALADIDVRADVAPSAVQREAAREVGAAVTWNQLGTPSSIVRYGGFVTRGVAGRDASAAALNWLSANEALFGLGSTDVLRLYSDTKLAGTAAHAVTFQQTFGGVRPVDGGLVTVGLRPSAGGWDVASVSSTLTPATGLAGSAELSPAEAYVAAAKSAGLGVKSLVGIQEGKAVRGWTALSVSGLQSDQLVKFGAFPTAKAAIPAYSVITRTTKGGALSVYRVNVDARDGSILSRTNLVDNAADLTTRPPDYTFTGSVPAEDGACDVKQGPIVITTTVRALDGEGDAVPANDMILKLYKRTDSGDVLLLASDTFTSPEFFHYEPPGGVTPGQYFVEVCDFPDDHPWVDPRTYTAKVWVDTSSFSLAQWKAFTNVPPLQAIDQYPWNNPDTDIRKLHCWVPGSGCDLVVGNLASRAPWDADAATGLSTQTTFGNNAKSAVSWMSPDTPSPPGYSPVSTTRDYTYPWTNAWFKSKCAPIPADVPTDEGGVPLSPGGLWDADAATVNLFVAHNRMHDFSYYLGFTERTWNAQVHNFGLTPDTQEGDPVLGDVQSGAIVGGYPTFAGRDNANMATLPDGHSSITNMYLWQPIQGSFYAPCVDGDYDMSVIGHEYSHMIENRLISKGGNRLGFHAGAMGEAFGDLDAMEYLNESGFTPGAGVDPFATGWYATGNKVHGIRNYAMDWPSAGTLPTPSTFPHVDPLNFSDIGYDTPSNEVHSDGEIWIATQFTVRQALNAKYDGSFPSSDASLQAKCAAGILPVENCPGNRRWIQLLYDSMILDPTGPTMIDARNNMLAADTLRFGGADQATLWAAYAARGFGKFAAVHSNTTQDTNPVGDFEDPVGPNATVTFNLLSKDGGGGPVVGNVYVGHYEALVTRIADTDPATTNSGIDVNRDNVSAFTPGTYDFVVAAPGYGHVRFTATFAAGENRTLNILMPVNWASKTNGATATGDNDPSTHATPENGDLLAASSLNNLIDDTENTIWRAQATPVDNGDGTSTLNVDGKQVTVHLGGGVHAINRVQVSAMLKRGVFPLSEGQRFTALRSFEIWACNGSGGKSCASDSDFTKVYTSAADAFPGDTPRPVAPELIIRSFDIPTTPATDLRLVVKSNQCSGGPAYQGEQDADPTFMTDCDTVSNVDVAKPLDDPTGTAVTWQFVRASEFQAFTTNPTVTGPAVSPPAASPPPPPPPPTNPPPPPAPKPKPKAPPRCVVPRVTGKTVAAARKAIKARRCRVGSIQSRNSRLAARGRVIAQTPRAGRRVAIGTRVSIVVSKGAVRGARVRFTG